MKDKRLLSAISYFVFWIPLILEREDEMVVFHTNQGLVLFLATLISSTIGSIIPIVGWFALFPLIGVANVILSVLGVVNCIKGEMKPLPLIGHYTILGQEN